MTVGLGTKKKKMAAKIRVLNEKNRLARNVVEESVTFNFLPVSCLFTRRSFISHSTKTEEE